ncbi:hypothetical protein N4T77_06790 [Clostridium sp. CX1]|uniref:Uncharacterized protein n=1 Tax=Clostridium tanneri TaxID=3037988 RepID=A0ABU4JXB5_9CLOT|nr:MULTISPECIES: hypothetical protein [unclassified Clostridium]MCT8976298.1 hypothetical protein [Clostridium sp. CX1]MDW8802756.1 hypothetical protein [Clostridium sp. A1-XYC3]
MRRAINFLGWIGVSFTILTLILTLLTTYQFMYVKYFDSYYTLQWCIFFTMIFWSIKMFEINNTLRSKLYPIACMVIAFGTIFFIFMKVY